MKNSYCVVGQKSNFIDKLFYVFCGFCVIDGTVFYIEQGFKVFLIVFFKKPWQIS